MIIDTVFSIFVICSDPACAEKVIGDEGRAVIKEVLQKKKIESKKDLIKKFQDTGVKK